MRISLNPFAALEHARNKRAWERLSIKPMNTPELILPPEFHLGQDETALREILQADITLAVAPFDYGNSARGYMQRLKYSDFSSWPQNNSLESLRPDIAFAGRHMYQKRELGIWHEKNKNPDAFGKKVAGQLAQRMPHAAGQDDFLDSLKNGIDMATRQFGAPDAFFLMISNGWMPPPEKLTPHHDVGTGVRVFFNIQGAGTFVAAAGSFPKEQQTWEGHYDHRGYYHSYPAYPSFNKLAEGWRNPQGKATILSIPPEYISAWKRGSETSEEEKNAPLPHASAACRNQLRINALMDFPNYRF